jgi:hypothetical protein
MVPRAVIIQLLLEVIFAGLAGTVAMTLLMGLIGRAGLAEADMIRAIGSVFTGSLDRSLLVGVTLYTLGGIVFALLYALVLSFIPIEGFWPTFGVSTLLGFVHGFVMSFLLVVTVAEHHPVERFRDAGFSVAFAHLLGHVAYGAAVGAVLGAIGLNISG